MSGDVINQAQSAFGGKPIPSNSKPKKRYPTPISVRFTDEERALLEQQAGDLTLSAYVRICVLRDKAPKHRTRSKKVVQDHELLGKLIGALGRSKLPNNINQLTKAVNNGTLSLDNDVALELERAARDIATMRQILLVALGLKGGA